MPTFMIPFNGKITGIIRGRKKQIDYQFLGGNGVPEPFDTEDVETIEILQQNKQVWLASEGDLADSQEPDRNTEGKVTVGPVTTHSDKAQAPPPDLEEELDEEPEETEEVSEPSEPTAEELHEANVAKIVGQLQGWRQEKDGYKKRVKPYIDHYGIKPVGRKREDVDREIAEAYIRDPVKLDAKKEGAE